MGENLAPTRIACWMVSGDRVATMSRRDEEDRCGEQAHSASTVRHSQLSIKGKTTGECSHTNGACKVIRVGGFAKVFHGVANHTGE